LLLLNPDDYENARQSRDPRFDGRFFVGVTTTGIYCRPICPVKIPLKKNVQLYPSAAAAAAAGFRPCLRCRPESSPGTPAWSGSSWKVSRALQLIDQGYLDELSVERLAEELDVTPRQLSRLFREHIGASPVEVAQTRRLHFAKKLIDETDLPLAEVCFAAGFGSVRRFNAVFLATYKRSPKELRQRLQRKQRLTGKPIQMTLSYRPPFDWKTMLEFLATRHIPGVEHVTENSYARTISIDGISGDFKVEFLTGSREIKIEINYPATKALYTIIDQIRSLFDLRADSVQIESFFEQDAILKPLVKNYPGMRVPGCWDGFEVSIRAILGQQVTVAAATTLAGRIARELGENYSGGNAHLTHIFPTAEAIVAGELSGLGIVGARILAIKALAEKVASNEIIINCTAPTDEFLKQICSIKGIGEWTGYYIAMRALSDPNAFPYSDLILCRAAAEPGESLTPKQLRELSLSWQPWRAYAVLLLWRHYGAVHKEFWNKKATKN
jgi:AraC family transcriptional regulator, regulatory protein of adaptative response / DNA-3-methyladenine glycosylase II